MATPSKSPLLITNKAPQQLARVSLEFLYNRPGDAKRVVDTFTSAIRESYRTKDTAVNKITEAETKRRFDICVDWLKTMRGDLGDTLSHSLEEIPKALMATLRGVQYVPAKLGRTMYGARG